MAPSISAVTDKTAWDAEVLSNSGHPLQLWGWGEVKARHGWAAYRYRVSDGDRILGLAQVLIRKLPWPFVGLAYVPRGPVLAEGTPEQVLQILAATIKRNHKVISLSVEPDTENWPEISGWRPAKNRILPSDTILLDLRLTEDALLSAMSKKTRQYVRKSQAELTEIREVDTSELETCFAIYRDTAARANFALRSDQYYLDVREQLGAERSPIYIAYAEGKPAAFLWLAVSDTVGWELYGGMNQLGQKYRANYALKWHAITECKRKGITRYDMGGLVEGGVSTFKRGWTAKDTNLAGSFDLPTSKLLYPIWNSLLPLAKKIISKARSLLKRG